MDDQRREVERETVLGPRRSEVWEALTDERLLGRVARRRGRARARCRVAGRAFASPTATETAGTVAARRGGARARVHLGASGEPEAEVELTLDAAGQRHPARRRRARGAVERRQRSPGARGALASPRSTCALGPWSSPEWRPSTPSSRRSPTRPGAGWSRRWPAARPSPRAGSRRAADHTPGGRQAPCRAAAGAPASRRSGSAARPATASTRSHSGTPHAGSRRSAPNGTSGWPTSAGCSSGGRPRGRRNGRSPRA